MQPSLLLKVILVLLVTAMSVAGGFSVGTALTNSDVSSQIVVTSTNNDVTADVELLGNPFIDRYADRIYARNVWDIQAFNGIVYLGSGNSSNEGPDRNAGPVDVWHFDPDRNAFVNEFTVDEEQIDIFRIIDGKLYIPGHDPLESWQLGNFYVLQNKA